MLSWCITDNSFDFVKGIIIIIIYLYYYQSVQWVQAGRVLLLV